MLKIKKWYWDKNEGIFDHKIGIFTSFFMYKKPVYFAQSIYHYRSYTFTNYFNELALSAVAIINIIAKL